MSHKGHEQETGLHGNPNELKPALHHTTKDDAKNVSVKKAPGGKAIYTESVAPIDKPSLPEKIQFPDVMTPDQHLAAAKRYEEEANKWRNKEYGNEEGLNAKKHNELKGKAEYHYGMAAQHPGLKPPTEHPTPILPTTSKLEEGPRVYKGKGTGQRMGTSTQAD